MEAAQPAPLCTLLNPFSPATLNQLKGWSADSLCRPDITLLTPHDLSWHPVELKTCLPDKCALPDQMVTSSRHRSLTVSVLDSSDPAS